MSTPMSTTANPPPLAVALPPPAPRPVRQFLRRLFREKPVGAAAALVFLLFVFCGVFADFLAPYGFNEIDMAARLKAPSWSHLFGTDNLGRDMFSRCLYGAQLSVIIGITVGRRDENNGLRALNAEELAAAEANLGGRIVNLPLMAGFDMDAPAGEPTPTELLN